jgi:prefoldin subunit 4
MFFCSYKVGEAFLHMPQSRALKRLERDQMSIDGKVATLALQADECEVQMKGLKVVLYAKFGKAINLDE